MNALQLEQLRFDAADQIRYARAISTEDPTTSNLILANKVFAHRNIFRCAAAVDAVAKATLGRHTRYEPGFVRSTLRLLPTYRTARKDRRSRTHASARISNQVTA